ncbi:MAG: hypothetical protein WBL50_26120 [Candidatus Acidiferrum sp.]
MRMCFIMLLFTAPPLLWAQNQPDSSDSTSLQLGADTLGESLSSFVSNHPNAKCVDSSTKTKNCYQWENVSIFDLKAHADAGCSPERHSADGCVQGLTAMFQDQKLLQLSYAVAGSDKSVVVATLRGKYGAPAIDTHDGTIWMRGNGVFSITVGKASENPNSPTLITFMIYRS